MDWFMAQINRGFFEVKNPYTKQKRTVDISCDNTLAIVFWSKNFNPFLSAKAGETLQKRGVHLYFNFTINSEDPLLEPEIPPLADRLSQLEELARRFGPDTIAWRFDPVCFYKTDNQKIVNNLSDLPLISDVAAKAGIKKCVTSFFDPYKKIDTRLKRLKKTLKSKWQRELLFSNCGK